MKNSKEPSMRGDGAAALKLLPNIPYKPDDDTITTHLVKDTEIAGKLSYFYASWRMYETGAWKQRDVYEVRRYVRQQLRAWREHGVAVNQGRIKELSSMLEDDLYIPDRKVMEAQEKQRQYVNLRNGMFNLETMEFEPRHDPHLLFISQLDFDYDPDADCPTFRSYLNSSLVFPDDDPEAGKPDHRLIMLLLEALGYSMTARTDMKASFWLVGKKDSGKSTFVALLKSLMGSLHATIDLNQLGTNRFLLSGIVGKRVVSFTESDSNAVLPDALYKTLVGGSDEIYADVKNRNGISFRPEAKVWWAMNDGQQPRVADRSGATMGRIHIIPFNRTIPQSERNPNLEQQLAAERSGIFNQMVIYLNRLQRAGNFEYCKQSSDRRKEYVMENDTEATYIQERMELHESYKVRGSELYDDYRNWCESNGFRPKNSNQIAKEWRRLGFQQKNSNGSWWHGLRIRTIKIDPKF